MPTANPTVNCFSRIAGAVLLSVSLTACASGTGVPASSSSSSSPAGTPAPESSSATAPGPSGIPAGGGLPGPAGRGAHPHPWACGPGAPRGPLRPCGDNDTYPSDSTRTAAVAMSYFAEPDAAGTSPTVLVEFVGRHARGGAAAQFDDIQAALERCPGKLGEKQRRWTVLDTDVAGEESVLVRIDETFSYGDEKPKTVSDYAAVARTGEWIVVVTDTGWENIGSSESLVRDLIGKAVQRAGAAG